MIGENTGTYSDFKGRNRVDCFTLYIEAWLIIFFYLLALASVPKETTEISIGRGENMRISRYLFTQLMQSLKYHRVVNEANFSEIKSETSASGVANH